MQVEYQLSTHDCKTQDEKHIAGKFRDNRGQWASPLSSSLVTVFLSAPSKLIEHHLENMQQDARTRRFVPFKRMVGNVAMLKLRPASLPPELPIREGQ